MSIVERALKKNRSAAPQSGARAAVERSMNRAQRSGAIDPTYKIVPTALKLDHELCRERRLLVGAGADHDRPAVAAYRMLRTRLLHRARAANWKIIAVTSAGPNDGKTLTTINLAFSMAREKSRDVILLDMDMRNPSVCRTLGVQPPRELRNYLEKTDGLRNLFFSVGIDNLMIAGGVTPTDQASELLSGNRFADLIDSVRLGSVDPIILIDLPPVLVTDDALVVAPKVDALMVVASQGLTDRSELTRALDMLAEFPIAGVVLNRALEKASYYSYGYEFDEGQNGKDSA